jgi:hypothetical protein
MVDIFKKHALPDATWRGWSPLVDEDDLQVRSQSVEGVSAERPNRNKTAAARARTSEVSLPNFTCPTFHSIDRTIKELMRDYSGLEYAINVSPTTGQSAISLKYDLKHDATKEMMRQMYSN